MPVIMPPMPVVENENQARDVQVYLLPEGDASFDPRRNEIIIEQSIKKAEKQRRDRIKKRNDEIGERVDAVTSYLFSMKGSHMPIEKYLGKKWLAHLRGQKILQRMERLKNGQTVIHLESLD